MEKEEMSDLGNRRLAGIMFTDIVGYTALMQSDEEQAFKVLERHNHLLRPFFPKYHGREVKTMGDSFLVEFDSALDATKCAIEIQKYLHDYNSSSGEDWKIKLRIGIHIGDVIHSRNDIFGDAVNIASRIESLAEPEGICITEQVYDQISNKLAYDLEKIEPKELKNVKSSPSVYKVVLPWERSSSLLAPHPAKIGVANRRIAVLPFANMSADPNDEYFSDGITEEVIATVAKIKGIEVISRTSIIQYKKTTKALRQIARELEVDTILEGSVRRAGNRIRVTVQMINAALDAHLWSENYDRDFKDVFEIQSDIAQSVAGVMKSRLLDEDKEEIERGSTMNPEAHMAYLLGKYLINRGNKEEQYKGIESLERAIKLDSSYAPAYAALSECYSYMAGQYISEKEGFERAKEYAQKAISLNDSLAEGHTALGLVALQYDWDWDRAKKELVRAIEINPSYSYAHLWYGFYLALVLRADEGVEELLKAEELDPLSHIVLLNVGAILYSAKRYDEAISKFEKAKTLEEKEEMPYIFGGLCYMAKSMYDDAIKEMIRGTNFIENSNILGALGYAYGVAGKRNEALDSLQRLENLGESAFSPYTNRAVIFIGLREYDKALDFLERALGDGESWLALLCLTRIYDPIRSTPRFAKIMKEIGLPVG
jgi:adenylate cyclase